MTTLDDIFIPKNPWVLGGLIIYLLLRLELIRQTKRSLVMSETPTSAPVGIEATKVVLGTAIELVNTIEKAKADGKIDAMDLGLLIPIIGLIGPTTNAIPGVSKELGDLTVAEISELSAFVVGKLAISDEKAKEVIAKSLKLVGDVLDLVQTIKG